MQKVEYQIKVYIIYIPAKIAPNFTGGNGGGEDHNIFWQLFLQFTTILGRKSTI